LNALHGNDKQGRDSPDGHEALQRNDGNLQLSNCQALGPALEFGIRIVQCCLTNKDNIRINHGIPFDFTNVVAGANQHDTEHSRQFRALGLSIGSIKKFGQIHGAFSLADMRPNKSGGESSA